MQTGRPFEYRPIYFGTWEVPFAVTDEGISYYSDSIGMEEIHCQFLRLYRKPLTFLNDYSKSKAVNFSVLMKHLSTKDREQFIFILVDLFYLPYPNQCYQTRHRPHILVVDHIDDNGCYLIDPYFSWQGYISSDIFEQSFYCGDFNLIVMLDKSVLLHPEPPLIAQILHDHLKLSPSQLVIQVTALVDKAISEEKGYTLEKLNQSVEQVSVIAKRYYGYEMAFSYLSEKLNLPWDGAQSKVAEMVKKWDNVVLSIMRIGMLSKREGLQPLKEKISHIGLLEVAIQQDLLNLNRQRGGVPS
jgi:hypothetical protein